jgi:hypothetical protein
MQYNINQFGRMIYGKQCLAVRLPDDISMQSGTGRYKVLTIYFDNCAVKYYDELLILTIYSLLDK